MWLTSCVVDNHRDSTSFQGHTAVSGGGHDREVGLVLVDGGVCELHCHTELGN